MEIPIRPPSTHSPAWWEDTLDADIERVSSARSNTDTACGHGCITVETDEETQQLALAQGEAIHDAISRGFGCDTTSITNVRFGGAVVMSGDTCGDHGIEEGARLSARIKRKASVEMIMEELVALNPHLTVQGLLLCAEVDPNEASRVLGHWSLCNKGITELPECIGDLSVWGNLYLNRNKLTSLPDSIGDLSVGGALCLDNNELTSLPDSIVGLQVGRNLMLDNNHIASLPGCIGELEVGGSLSLDGNQLTSLPHSIGGLLVGGHLTLGGNQLTSLPVSFSSIDVAGDIYGVTHLQFSRENTSQGEWWGCREYQAFDRRNV